eukprot:TRINITY_DN18189_c0_g3_i1.p1 TRINITY_DN18189_c0_g3~~TRINITY_DN18189_c0_g3_i1.p1  ORF type:complete len:171 (+),score=2.41 TRINITY_DN18189_c0_g3_i1:100-612(+)
MLPLKHLIPRQLCPQAEISLQSLVPSNLYPDEVLNANNALVSSVSFLLNPKQFCKLCMSLISNPWFKQSPKNVVIQRLLFCENNNQLPNFQALNQIGNVPEILLLPISNLIKYFHVEQVSGIEPLIFPDELQALKLKLRMLLHVDPKLIHTIQTLRSTFKLQTKINNHQK